jgi:hypothetical protein
MITSCQHLITSVIASLEKEVLPHLNATARPASSVRACLMLLTHAAQRITLDAKVLFGDNRSLRTLLREAGAGADQLDLDASLRSRIADALKQYPERAEYFDIDAALHENEAYQETLTQLINQLGKNRTHGDPEAHKNFRTILHRYLDELSRRDLEPVHKALGMAPV